MPTSRDTDDPLPGTEPRSATVEVAPVQVVDEAPAPPAATPRARRRSRPPRPPQRRKGTEEVQATQIVGEGKAPPPVPERRLHERVAYRAAVRLVFSEHDDAVPCDARDLSVGGLLLHLRTGSLIDPPEVGELIEVRLTALDCAMTLDAEVVRRDGDAFAVRFVSLDRGHKLFLDELVEQARSL